MIVLDIVIVNWNAGDLLRNCVRSLAAAFGAASFFRVIVVDNASTDGSADRLDAGSAPLTVIRNKQNLGFAAACNQGAEIGSAPYLLLLNPDTEVGRDALERAVAFMDSSAAERVGICGVQLRDANGVLARTCARFPALAPTLGAIVGLDRVLPRVVRPRYMRESDHGTSRQVDQVMGAFFLVRRVLWTDLDGLDERFFVYYEEVDFCRRALDRGWATYYFADAAIVHVGCGTTDQIRATRLFYSLRSRILYGYKHYNRPSRVINAVASAAIEPMIRIAVALGSGDRRKALEAAHAARLLWADAMSILRTTRRLPAVRQPQPSARRHA